MARVVLEWSVAHYCMFFTAKQLNCCVLTELKGEGGVLAQEKCINITNISVSAIPLGDSSICTSSSQVFRNTKKKNTEKKRFLDPD